MKKILICMLVVSTCLGLFACSDSSEDGMYKSLNLKERLPEMTEEEQLRLLASDGMLVKRPILVTEERILVGFREAEWAEVEKC